MPYPIEFRPEATADLVRIGAKLDGGYVLPQRIVAATKGLLSFGLSDEFEFERAFYGCNPIPVVVFDHTVTGRFWLRKFAANVAKGLAGAEPARLSRAFRFLAYLRFFDGKRRVHVKRPLGYTGTGAVSFTDALRISGLEADVFLKMDIEGWEYRLLSAIVDSRDLFTGMAIEFHDVDLHEDRIVDFLNAISDDFVLVHFHANSHTQVGPGRQPLVVEMSLMNRRLLQAGERLSRLPLPIPGLDAPNLPGDTEAPVTFAEAS